MVRNTVQPATQHLPLCVLMLRPAHALIQPFAVPLHACTCCCAAPIDVSSSTYLQKRMQLQQMEALMWDSEEPAAPGPWRRLAPVLLLGVCAAAGYACRSSGGWQLAVAALPQAWAAVVSSVSGAGGGASSSKAAA